MKKKDQATYNYYPSETEDLEHIAKAIENLQEYMFSAVLDDDFSESSPKRMKKIRNRIKIVNDAVKVLKKLK